MDPKVFLLNQTISEQRSAHSTSAESATKGELGQVGGFLILLLSFGFVCAVTYQLMTAVRRHYFSLQNTRRLLRAIEAEELEVVSYWGDLMILLEGRGSHFVIVNPKVLSSGKLEFKQHSVPIQWLDIPRPSDPRLVTLKMIAPVVRNRCKLAEQLYWLKSSTQEVKDLQRLVKKSEYYASRVGLYNKALNFQTPAIAKSQTLLDEQDGFIREILIGAKIAEFDPDNIISNEQVLDINSQLQHLQEQFQDTREYIDAYLELKEGSSSSF